MGLDQFAYLVKKTKKLPDICHNRSKHVPKVVDGDFAYWRKNNELQRWMNALAVEKGFDERKHNFNCVMVRLKKKDIKRLKDEVKHWTYEMSGAFDEEWFEYDKKSTLEFCKKALKAIDDGYAVYYDSWW